MPEYANRYVKRDYNMCYITKSTAPLSVWWVLGMFHKELVCYQLGNIYVLRVTFQDCI